MKILILLALFVCGTFRVTQENYNGLETVTFTVEAKSIEDAANKAAAKSQRIIKIEEVLGKFVIYVNGEAYGGWREVEVVPPVIGTRWTVSGIETQSEMTLGKEPLVCEGTLMLSSHLARVLGSKNRIDEITIRRIKD